MKELVIGNQIWSDSNSSVKHFRNGDLIVEAKSAGEWTELFKAKVPAWAYRNYDSKNSEGGLVYNGYAIIDEKNIAPNGWRMPSSKDWQKLINYLKSDQGKKIKSISGWAGDGNGDGSTEFNALPDFSMVSSGDFWDVEDKGMYTEIYALDTSRNILGGLCLSRIILENWISSVAISTKSASHGAAVRFIK
jgi:uncharacterized protein (TIGR02145 family)